jgi:NAD(P)H-hydrate epimerase
MSSLPYPESAPVFSAAEAQAWEQARFAGPGGEAAEWEAMQAAGAGVAAGVQRDVRACVGAGWGAGARILVLVGKGHNGGDALIAARLLLAAVTGATAEVFVFGERSLRPLAARAWRELPVGRSRSRGASSGGRSGSVLSRSASTGCSVSPSAPAPGSSP